MKSVRRSAGLMQRALLGWSMLAYSRSGNAQSTAYWRLRRDRVLRSLDDAALREAFKHSQPLPSGYGMALDERVVEYPWLFARLPEPPWAGRVLDAGSVLNFPELLRHPSIDASRLHIVTLAPEAHCDWRLGTSYLFHDLRALPLKDATYQAVVSLSTLEHVGMDNQRYGADGTTELASTHDLTEAVRELRRVLLPGGACFISVPYGVDESHQWYRSFDRTRLDRLIEAFAPTRVDETFYRYHIGAGWQISTATAAADARCADARPQPGLISAEAVVCLQLTA